MGPEVLHFSQLPGDADVVPDQHLNSKNLAPTLKDTHNDPRCFLATTAFFG